jgi:hypothetical protein
VSSEIEKLVNEEIPRLEAEILLEAELPKSRAKLSKR